MTMVSKTADNALRVLFALSGVNSATPQQLASRLELNRTVTQRLLATLYSQGFVNREGGDYSLAPLVGQLAQCVQPHVRRAVEPWVWELSRDTGETVVFQIVDGNNLVVLAEAFQTAEVSLHVRDEVGSRYPITKAAPGLAVLAAMEDSEIVRSLKPDEIDSVLRERLDQVRRSGFAQTSGELQAGVTGLATAVKDGSTVIGSLAILVPSARAVGIEGYRSKLGSAAEEIERLLAADTNSR